MADSASSQPGQSSNGHHSFERAGSVSQASETSQTAQEFISSQLQLEAEAREVLPYQFDTCTRPLGPLRQLLFSCLTCNPPPSDPTAPYTPAGVCYSCSISCHGEHTLVELFNKRNFVCDCGTTRITSSAPCTLRLNSQGQKGNVTGETPAEGNEYNQNFANRFCGCGEIYDAHSEKGTMFQCLGLGKLADGGCGEDWWHPECLVGLPRGWWRKNGKEGNGAERQGKEPESGDVGSQAVEDEEGDPPYPPGFPPEDDFDGLLCYKCVNAFPWIKRYAGTEGFLPPVHYNPPTGEQPVTEANTNGESKKRKADDEGEQGDDESSAKRVRSSSQPPAESLKQTDEESTAAKEEEKPEASAASSPTCRYETLPTALIGTISLCLHPNFRESFCRCPTHFPLLAHHPQLLEEEETYEPPISESSEGMAQSAGSKSLLDRGEAALSNIDRVRAIEGVMVYNHLRDKVKDFLKPFAESGKVVGAEDIKAYFETLRGDAEAMREMRAKQRDLGGGDGENDSRREQGGY
ncbi:uncharacterized protein PV09_03600 [Verruconis gallopava]|uniref:UBR-type domain-containing protein n=1 Tax=Verruconis gallopava TaxID=253628 RepID=A0A0D2B358_9PEZI|nr:uncharacterized protein PV09_03600 [Verruconis gallopava]KIW05744.1 hypothetical protein PV09_03600 [Verruconis gallopava]